MRILLIQRPYRRLKSALEEQGYVVETCELHQESASKAGTNDLVVLDVETAGRPGLVHLMDWRRGGVATPVLALAPHDAPADKVAALDSGADALLSKPFHRDELLAQVRAMLRRVSSPQRGRLQVFDLELDLSRRTATRAGQAIRLTRREFDLLHLLVNQRGKVLSRGEIWNHLSGQTEVTNSNLIDVYIRYLRKKIDNGFALPLILTAWGHGYRLRAEAELEAAC